MSIKQYLTPIRLDDFGFYPSQYDETLGSVISAYTPNTPFPSIPEGGLVLVGVEEDRGAVRNEGCSQAPNQIRRYLYQLAIPVPDAHIVDLGNLVVGQIAEDTYYALSEVVAHVLSHKSVPIILGGSNDLTFAAYKGFERMGQLVNLASIDSRFDLQLDDQITSRTWLRNIIMQTPNHLFLHSHLGYQTHFVGAKGAALMDELKFDACRLSDVQQDMPHAEALLRMSNLVSVDIGAVRQSDAPGNGYPSPHGFYGQELCQLLRFAGMSNKVSCLGLFEVNPLFDHNGQTAHLASHAIWYFIEGYYNRRQDDPEQHPESCKHYHCTLQDPDMEVEFFKSKLSDRWWMQVPCNNPEQQKIYTKQFLLPCTYSDYLNTLNEGKLPALWWTYYERMNS